MYKAKQDRKSVTALLALLGIPRSLLLRPGGCLLLCLLTRSGLISDSNHEPRSIEYLKGYDIDVADGTTRHHGAEQQKSCAPAWARALALAQEAEKTDKAA